MKDRVTREREREKREGERERGERERQRERVVLLALYLSCLSFDIHESQYKISTFSTNFLSVCNTRIMFRRA